MVSRSKQYILKGLKPFPTILYIGHRTTYSLIFVLTSYNKNENQLCHAFCNLPFAFCQLEVFPEQSLYLLFMNHVGGEKSPL